MTAESAMFRAVGNPLLISIHFIVHCALLCYRCCKGPFKCYVTPVGGGGGGGV